MNVLLIGEKYSTNLGDGVIFLVTQRIIKKQDPDIKIFELDLSGRISYNDDIDWLLSWRQRLVKTFYSADLARACLVRERLEFILRKTSIDLVVFAGGQIFMDYFIPTVEVIVKTLNKRNIPVVFNACGVGKISTKNCFKLNKLLNSHSVKAIALRDGFENSVFSDLKIVKAYDPVIEVSDFYNMKNKGRKVQLGINLMSPWVSCRSNPEEGNRRTKQLLYKAIAFCDKRRLSWEVYSNGGVDDVGYIMGACEQMGIPKSKVAEHPNSPEKLISLVERYERIVGFRMHTHVIANSFHIPTLGFIWDKKVADYAEATQQKNSFIPFDDTAISGVEKNLKELLLRHDAKMILKKERVKSSAFLSQLIEATYRKN